MNMIDLPGSAWAILPSTLLDIQAICARHAAGQKADIAALETAMGRSLQHTRTVTMRGATAMIPITGPIFRYANLFSSISGATSLAILAADFSAAEANPAVREIVLVIDSPGGQANGIAEFAQLVRASSKPVIAYVDNTAASAAYWIAAAANQIVMAKTAMVGSIGVVITVDHRKPDGQVEIISSQSPNKRADVTTDDGRAQIQALIDGLAQVFVEDVATYRHATVETVLADFGGGGMKLAQSAVALGMADSIGTLETLLASLSAKTHLSTNQGLHMPNSQILTLTELRSAYPELAAQLVAEGASAERQRIADVEAQAIPGHDALVIALKADGTTTGAEAAIQILAAERTKLAAIATRLQTDSPPLIRHAHAPSETSPGSDANLPLEARCTQAWQDDATLHAEFSSLDAYIAFERASASKRARIFGHNSAAAA